MLKMTHCIRKETNKIIEIIFGQFFYYQFLYFPGVSKRSPFNFFLMKYNRVTIGESFPLCILANAFSEDNFVGEKNISIGIDFSKLNEEYACLIDKLNLYPCC